MTTQSSWDASLDILCFKQVGFSELLAKLAANAEYLYFDDKPRFVSIWWALLVSKYITKK